MKFVCSYVNKDNENTLKILLTIFDKILQYLNEPM